jgi:CheY-like chemotaxis protein
MKADSTSKDIGKASMAARPTIIAGIAIATGISDMTATATATTIATTTMTGITVSFPKGHHVLKAVTNREEIRSLGARKGRNSIRRLRMLVADDNEADIHWLTMVLDQTGIDCELSVVYDGEQAREFLLGRGKFAGVPPQDLIFLDLNLPKLTGIEVLRQVPGSDRLPFCIVTGSETEREILSREFGIRRIAYLVKPVDRMKILNCFRCYAHLRDLADKLAS